MTYLGAVSVSIPRPGCHCFHILGMTPSSHNITLVIGELDVGKGKGLSDWIVSVVDSISL